MERCMRVAEELVYEFSRFKNVVGILFLGGLARGFIDEYSDLDIDVVLEIEDKGLRESIYELGVRKAQETGLDIDLTVHSLEEFKAGRWSDMDRWEFSKAQVRYDPKGLIKEVLKEKLSLGEDYWINKIVEDAVLLEFYGYSYGKPIIADALIKRGSLPAAHHTLNHAFELTLNLLYALNGEFTPPPKWKLFYVEKLEWKPEECGRLLKEALEIKDFTEEEVERRKKALEKLSLKILDKVKSKLGLDREGIHKYYRDKIL